MWREEVVMSNIIEIGGLVLDEDLQHFERRLVNRPVASRCERKLRQFWDPEIA